MRRQDRVVATECWDQVEWESSSAVKPNGFAGKWEVRGFEVLGIIKNKTPMKCGQRGHLSSHLPVPYNSICSAFSL